jgi:hypothetical protein
MIIKKYIMKYNSINIQSLYMHYYIKLRVVVECKKI